ncbi:secretion protein HlyD [Methyloceanibacter stevinii]|uniref:Secretion protein HlyD n=1 Tax=Methyloceanibacter stevinii TaxID=1774970 RepID=A0A1E3VQ10_9HYPH|nr:biotin/lipoyl-binding protein [Methyloceanibacter stevinii]ODR95615.1 secretion protein HlyD [Methyloceanibacter stevinii]
MIELIFSFLVTILPDYLYRRYGQGKRFGEEITLYNFWYELRWGITACAVLTTTLVTVIFYFHPIASNVIVGFRTVSIISDRPGRVEEVYVTNNQEVKAGDRIFSLDTSRQRAAAETARRRIAEVDAAMTQAQSELSVAKGNIVVAEGALRQAQDELKRREELYERNPSVVSAQELVRLGAAAESREGALKAARAQRDVVESQISASLPAQRASAEAALAEAETEIEKATVFAGTDGTVKQFVLRRGDIVSPVLRPAGILVPTSSEGPVVLATFGQISAQVLHVGMITEITCSSKPLTVIPMVITDVQDVIAGGQVRPSDQLLDVEERARPGTILTFLEPVFEGSQAGALPRGSVCNGVAYTSHARAIDEGKITGGRALLMRVVDGMGIANAIVIRAQALMLPIRAVIFGG